ncbi:MAG: hypothetical protein N7Q72_07620, partial [Spiroplasma sp. Tabriz.8]|nr:hypothetical protein [Spiroplasma sp. Tabriz.8]
SITQPSSFNQRRFLSYHTFKLRKSPKSLCITWVYIYIYIYIYIYGWILLILLFIKIRYFNVKIIF